MSQAPREFQICKFEPGNPIHRERVRTLCADTGYLGQPIDPVFEDRELFADYLTSYYTDREPESAFLLLVNGEVKGYLLGARFPKRQKAYDLRLNISLFLRGIFRYPRYNAATKAYVKWIFTTAWKEVPEAPKDCAHFHINLLPEARTIPTTRGLLEAFFQYLHQNGEKRVFGQMVTYEGRRGKKMFERYGFMVLNKSRITKYDGVYSEPVYLCTVVKDLEERTQLYGGGLVES